MSKVNAATEEKALDLRGYSQGHPPCPGPPSPCSYSTAVLQAVVSMGPLCERAL